MHQKLSCDCCSEIKSNEDLFLKFLAVCALLFIALSMGCKSSDSYKRYSSMGEKTESKAQEDQPLSQYAEHVYLYLEREKRKYSFENPRAQLAYSGENIDKLQKKHVRFQQVQKDVPVWGREIIVHLDENNSVYSISGEILTGLNMLNTKPAIAPEEAGDVIIQASQWGGKGWQVKDTELYIFNQNSNNHLAYRLTLSKGLLREFVFINAHNGEIIHRISGTHTIK